MIINLLELHNFMSYADARLDLSSISLACFTGENGSGKSALLDAISWVLWEQARSASDDLIRLGEYEMWVSLNLTVDGQIYRVRRSRSLTFTKAGGRSGAKSTLDFQVYDPGAAFGLAEDEGRWRSLNAGSLKDTQNSLTACLGMNYDAFISSVYLCQGRADEFTLRSPAERKQVLGEILGLQLFDRLQEQAREGVRVSRAKAQALESGLEAASDIQSELDGLMESIFVATKTLEEYKTELADHCRSRDELQQKKEDYQRYELELVAAQARLPKLQKEIADIHLSIERLTQTTAQLQEIIARKETIGQSALVLENIKTELEVLDKTELLVHELTARRYEIWSELASLRGRMEMDLEHRQQQRAKDLARLQELRKAVGDKSAVEEKFAELRKLLLKETELSGKYEAYLHLRQRQESLQLMIAEIRGRLEAELEQKRLLTADTRALVVNVKNFDGEKAAIEKELQQMDAKEMEFENVEAEGLKLKGEVAAFTSAIYELKKRISEIREKIDELNRATQKSHCPLCSAPILDRTAVIARYYADIEQLNHEIANLENEIAWRDDKLNNLRRQFVELRRYLDSRQELDRRIGEFNERHRSLRKATDNLQTLEHDIDKLAVQLEEGNYAIVERESLISIKLELERLAFDPAVYTDLQSQVKSMRYIDYKYKELKADLSELAELEERLAANDAFLAGLEKRLKDNITSPEGQGKLDEIDQSLADCRYDRQRHLEMKKRITELMPVLDDIRLLDRAQKELPLLMAECESWQKKLTDLEAELEFCEKQINLRCQQLEKQDELLVELEAHLAEINKLELHCGELEKEKLLLEGRLSQLDKGQRVLAKQKDELAAYLEEYQDLSLLVEAFGKKGLQAVIIENAMPEIESEANYLLSELTDNQMHISLITQTRTKQGNPVETLDILIADNVGTRPYELYSGGETFKVNFAIRVALAKLLLRRTGTKPETLIIDEGFGSQDESSRERLLKVISAIKKDFARILVITHIAEIKDAFPLQVLVQKIDGISSLQMVG